MLHGEHELVTILAYASMRDGDTESKHERAFAFKILRTYCPHDVLRTYYANDNKVT